MRSTKTLICLLLMMSLAVSCFAQSSEGQRKDVEFVKERALRPDDVDVLEDIDDMLFSDFFNVLNEDLDLIEEESLEDDYQETIPQTPSVIKDEVSTEVFADDKLSSSDEIPVEELISE